MENLYAVAIYATTADKVSVSAGLVIAATDNQAYNKAIKLCQQQFPPSLRYLQWNAVAMRVTREYRQYLM